MKIQATARLLTLAADDLTNTRKLVKERNDRIVQLSHSLVVNGFKGWRVERDHPLNVFKPSWSLAIGNWHLKEGVPIDNEEVKRLVQFLSRVYTLDKSHSENRKRQAFYAFTQGEDINLGLGINKMDSVSDEPDILNPHVQVPYYAELWYYTPE